MAAVAKSLDDARGYLQRNPHIGLLNVPVPRTALNQDRPEFKAVSQFRAQVKTEGLVVHTSPDSLIVGRGLQASRVSWADAIRGMVTGKLSQRVIFQIPEHYALAFDAVFSMTCMWMFVRPLGLRTVAPKYVAKEYEVQIHHDVVRSENLESALRIIATSKCPPHVPQPALEIVLQDVGRLLQASFPLITSGSKSLIVIDISQVASLQCPSLTIAVAMTCTAFSWIDGSYTHLWMTSANELRCRPSLETLVSVFVPSLTEFPVMMLNIASVSNEILDCFAKNFVAPSRIARSLSFVGVHPEGADGAEYRAVCVCRKVERPLEDPELAIEKLRMEYTVILHQDTPVANDQETSEPIQKRSRIEPPSNSSPIDVALTALQSDVGLGYVNLPKPLQAGAQKLISSNGLRQEFDVVVVGSVCQIIRKTEPWWTALRLALSSARQLTVTSMSSQNDIRSRVIKFLKDNKIPHDSSFIDDKQQRVSRIVVMPPRAGALLSTPAAASDNGNAIMVPTAPPPPVVVRYLAPPPSLPPKVAAPPDVVSESEGAVSVISTNAIPQQTQPSPPPTDVSDTASHAPPPSQAAAPSPSLRTPSELYDYVQAAAKGGVKIPMPAGWSVSVGRQGECRIALFADHLKHEGYLLDINSADAKAASDSLGSRIASSISKVQDMPKEWHLLAILQQQQAV